MTRARDVANIDTILTAKGDIYAASAAYTPTRLAAGADGSTLLANSASSVGLTWQPQFLAGKNKVINGDFGIWQRGTSFSLTSGVGVYTADRFRHNYDGTGATRTVSRQSFTAGTAPVAGYEAQYFYRYDQSVAGSTGTYNNFLQTPLEDVRTFANQTITISFWFKSAAAKSITVGFVQNFGAGGSSDVVTSFGTFTSTTSWVRYSFTAAVPSVSGKTIGASSFAQIYMSCPNNETQTHDVWGLQAEAGSVATPFSTATGTLQGELALAQRYYMRFSASGAYTQLGQGIGNTTTNGEMGIPLPVQMRVAPTAIDYSTIRLYDTIADHNVTAVSLIYASPNYAHFNATTTGLTVYRPYYLFGWNSTSAYIGFSAEL